jgi:hypothetical protein
VETSKNLQYPNHEAKIRCAVLNNIVLRTTKGVNYCEKDRLDQTSMGLREIAKKIDANSDLYTE